MPSVLIVGDEADIWFLVRQLIGSTGDSLRMIGAASRGRRPSRSGGSFAPTSSCSGPK